jgi:hypothetical protein
MPRTSIGRDSREVGLSVATLERWRAIGDPEYVVLIVQTPPR